MIQLSRLDGDVLLVNPDTIRTVARLGPNSSLRFGDGNTVVVVESPEIIAERVADWERRLQGDGQRAATEPVSEARHGSGPCRPVLRLVL